MKRTGKGRAALALALGLGILGPVWADSSLSLSGSTESYFYLIGRQPLASTAGGWLSYTPLRARLLYKPDGVLTFEAAEELDPLTQQGTGGSVAAFLSPVSSYRLVDLPSPLAGPAVGDGARLLQNLDRFSLSLRWGKLDATLGRQVVSFGSARLVNPTDVLAPFNFQTLDQENRSGVDAIRLRYSWGEFAGQDVGFVAGKDARWDQDAFFVRPHFRALGIDTSVLGMIFRENKLAGLDLQGSLGGAGWWAEGAWVWPKNGDPDYARLTAGADYFFADGVEGSLEYHFNGAGQQEAAQYLSLNPTAYGSGTVYLLGRHYLAPAFSWQADPLLSLRGQAIVNLTDGSWWLLAHAEYNALENLYADLGIAMPFGAGPAGFQPQSEFGLYPAFQYLDLRYYF